MAACRRDRVGDALRSDARVRLVDCDDVDVDRFAEDAASPAIERESVQHGQGIRRNRRAEPLNDVAIVVVMRRLDEVERKPFRHGVPKSIR